MFDPVRFTVFTFLGFLVFHPGTRFATADVLRNVADTISAPETSQQ
jgi:hypothetical protein